MSVLSIQSEVVRGHVGNAAARFALQLRGHDALCIPTVLLSSHAGYARVAGEAVSGARIASLVDALDANGWLAACDGVLSGYLASADQAEVIADAVRRVRRAKACAIYCLDPVFGDEAGAYAEPAIAEAMAKHLLPLADIVTPNRFELASLAGVPVRDAADARLAAGRLGRPIVLATSIPVGIPAGIPAGSDRIGALAASGGEAWFAHAPRIAQVPHGAGDLLAALFLAHRLDGAAIREALGASLAATDRVLFRSMGFEEMRLVAEQDAIRHPPDTGRIRIEKL